MVMSSKSQKSDQLKSVLAPSFLLRFPHHIEPSHNVFINQRPRSTLVNDERKPTIYKSTYPSPVYTAPDPNPANDYPLKLVQRKLAYTAELQRLKVLSLRNKKKPQKRDEIPVHSKYFQQFAEWLERDPDPHFTGIVNWYFTGSTMKTVTFEDRVMLCHTFGPELNQLAVSDIVQQNTGIAIKYTTTSRYEQCTNKKGAIYELNSMKNSSQLMIRQKHSIAVLDLHEHHNEPPTAITLTSPKNPFISCTYNTHTKLLSTIDTELNLIRWHLLESAEPLAVHKCQLTKADAKSDNWNCLRTYNDEHVICHTDRRRVHLFDDLVMIDPNQPTFRYDFTDVLSHCEEITCMERSPHNNLVYIGTTHSVFAVDFRQANSANVQLLKWKHHLKTSPAMLDIICNSSTDVVAVGGRTCGDVRIFEAINTDTEVNSTRLLYKPLSMCDTYNVARKYGHCLSPMSCVRRQSELSQVGLLSLGTTDVQHLMTQNSAGTVFVQKITNKEICDDVSVAESIAAWDEQLMEHSRAHSQPLATTLTNFKSLHGALRFDLNTLDETIVEPIPSRPRQKWQQTIKELSSYADLLSKDMLALWEVKNECDLRPKTPPIDCTANVHNWLIQSETAVADEVALPEISVTSVMEELPDLLDTSQTKRPPKAKRKYVPGF